MSRPCQLPCASTSAKPSKLPSLEVQLRAPRAWTALSVSPGAAIAAGGTAAESERSAIASFKAFLIAFHPLLVLRSLRLPGGISSDLFEAPHLSPPNVWPQPNANHRPGASATEQPPFNLSRTVKNRLQAHYEQAASDSHHWRHAARFPMLAEPIYLCRSNVDFIISRSNVDNVKRIICLLSTPYRQHSVVFMSTGSSQKNSIPAISRGW